jgi:hypothetical protein
MHAKSAVVMDIVVVFINFSKKVFADPKKNNTFATHIEVLDIKN